MTFAIRIKGALLWARRQASRQDLAHEPSMLDFSVWLNHPPSQLTFLWLDFQIELPEPQFRAYNCTADGLNPNPSS